MLKKYEQAVRGLPPEAERAVVTGLGLPRYPGSLYEMLEAAGYWQSDVVLALLRADTEETLSAAEALLGRPITRCPPGARRTPERVGLQAGIDQVLRIIGLHDTSDLRRFAWVAQNTQLPTTPSWHRFRLLYVGMTVGQFVARGGYRRDVREWSEAGKIRLRF